MHISHISIYYNTVYVIFYIILSFMIDIGHLVCVKGMVTRASDVKPQVTVVTYTCEMCGSDIFQEVLNMKIISTIYGFEK